jgi:dipeptidyl-peptidase 4
MNRTLLILTAWAAAQAASVSPALSEAERWNEPITAFSWAPDSSRVAYCGARFSSGSSEAQLWMIDATSSVRTLVLSSERLAPILRGGPCRVVWHPSSGRLLIAGSHQVDLLTLESGALRPVVASKPELGNVSLSPNGDWISYVAGGKLCLRGLLAGPTRVVAQSDATTLRAQPDWLYRNRLAMDAAYWWAPDSSAIAYLEIGRIPKLFPVAGDPLPRIGVGVAHIGASHASRQVRLPDGEAYLSQVAWTPDSRSLAITRLDRRQTTLELLLAEVNTGAAKQILAETDPYWINADPRGLRFLDDGKHFLWTSERTGFRHVFLYETSGRLVSQITRGDWEVTSIDAIDGRAVVFTSTRQSPIERQLYRQSFDSLGEPVRLTDEPGRHSARFAPDANAFIDLSSSASQLPSVSLVNSAGQPEGRGRRSSIHTPETQLLPVEFSTVRTHDGLTLNTMLLRPPEFDPSRKYPVLILAPTGPRSQIVMNASGEAEMLWAQRMARLGYVVFAADGRGSGGRGRRFEEPIHFRLGGMELPDQLDALAFLRKQTFVDMKRLGIWGSSYGGMIALGAMMHSHGMYRAGFADSPITDWTAVDAFTAERYLGPKSDGALPYNESSPNEFAGRLEGRLMITSDPDLTPSMLEHVQALRAELEEKHKLTAARATIELADHATVFDRATRFFIEALNR